MATAIFGPKGRERAVRSISTGDGNIKPVMLKMNTFPATSTTPDPEMWREITWGWFDSFAGSTNKLKVKEEGVSEFVGALLFPIAANRKFSNMTLHLSDTMLSPMLTFGLEGANSAVVGNYGTAKLVGEIKISF